MDGVRALEGAGGHVLQRVSSIRDTAEGSFQSSHGS